MSSAVSILPITFPVFLNEQPVDVTLEFADNSDVMSTTRWKVPGIDDAAMRGRAADSRELALLAAKRWRYYRDSGCAARSIEQLQQLIAGRQDGEFCFHLKISAGWFPASLGGAMLRRTWNHHIALDFLFVHPRIASRTINVKFVGVQLLQAICMIAHRLGCGRVWGETTPDSAPFYRRYLQQPVDDQFAIGHDEIASLAATFLSRRTA